MVIEGCIVGNSVEVIIEDIVGFIVSVVVIVGLDVGTLVGDSDGFAEVVSVVSVNGVVDEVGDDVVSAGFVSAQIALPHSPLIEVVQFWSSHLSSPVPSRNLMQVLESFRLGSLLVHGDSLKMVP